ARGVAADGDQRVGKFEELDVLERIGAVGADIVGDRPAAVGILNPAVVGGIAREDRCVAAGPAIERVVAASTGELVVAGVAGDVVGAGAAHGILDQRPSVAVVEECVGDVSGGVLPVAEIGELRRGNSGPSTGIEVDREVGGVVREIVSVVAAAVPKRHEDPVAGERALTGAVHVLLAGGRAP